MSPELVRHDITVIADITKFTHTFFDSSWEVDRVRIELEWLPADLEYPEDAEGWNVTCRILGWPLTKKGERFKNRGRESVRSERWPDHVRVAVREAYEFAVSVGRIEPDAILGRDGRPGSPITLL